MLTIIFNQHQQIQVSIFTSDYEIIINIHIYLTLYYLFIVSECLDVQLSELGKLLFIRNFMSIYYHVCLLIFFSLDLNEIIQDDESNNE
jgi:hypothetical protein